MEEISNSKWVHMGNDHIDEDKFEVRNTTYNSPRGVLWLSKKLGKECEWGIYSGRKNDCLSDKNCIVNLIENPNILILNDESLLKDLPKEFFLDDNTLNYEMISNYYDGIYIKKYLDKNFEYFPVDSLILFNSKPIKSYQKVDMVSYYYQDPYGAFEENIFEITKIYDEVYLGGKVCR